MNTLEVISFLLGVSTHVLRGAPTIKNQNLTSPLCGNLVEFGELTSVVSLVFKESHACDAIILDPNWILTSCISYRRLKSALCRLSKQNQNRGSGIISALC